MGNGPSGPIRITGGDYCPGGSGGFSIFLGSNRVLSLLKIW